MKLEKGDKVILTDNYVTGFFSSINKGTKGVVTDIEWSLFSDTYIIKFDNEEIRFTDSDAEKYICKI